MTFTERSRDALKAYWRTAVVIDDQALTPLEESATVTTLNTPVRGGKTSQEIEKTTEFSGAPLDAKALVDAFLKQNILCTVLDCKEVLTNNIDALLRSDILILDWRLKDDGSTTAKFINDCASRHPNALHMICIYTSSIDLESIKQKLKSSSSSLKEISDKEGVYAIGSTYVLVVNKNASGANTRKRCAEPTELPELLFKEFAPLVGGLLRNAVFHSIGAIRTNTHALLDRFHPDLDPAFITHRVYSNPCEDTEQHIIPLICSEINSILAQADIPQKLNSEQIQCWLDSNWDQNKDVKIPQELKKIINDNLSTILKQGIMTVNDFKNSSSEVRKKLLKDSLLTTFWGANDGAISDAMLSVLMSCEHRYSNVEPQLKPGTIIKLQNRNQYFLCIQPPCDCVRIETKGRPFVFAHISKSNRKKKFNFVRIKPNDNTITYLAKSSKAYHASLIQFRPTSGKTYISATEDSGVWLFTDVAGNKYELILQLNELHALRAIQECSNHLSRIGLMESDWQRRCTMGEHL